MSESQTDMGIRLRQARIRAGWPTATAAAAELKIPEGTYLGHENGSRGFKARAPRYARFYRVRLEWLLTGRGSPTGDPLGELFGRIPPDRQPMALEYLRFLAEPKGEKP